MDDKDINQLIIRAQRKTNINPMFSWFISPKWREAAELYEKAGNCYKKYSKIDQAGDMYLEAAKCYDQCKEEYYSFDSKESYVKAFNCYKNTNKDLALECMEKVIDMETNAGKFQRAANQNKILAEFYLSHSEISNARKTYEKAGKLYREEGQNVTAIKCYCEAATLLAMEKNYHDAAKTFEDISLDCVKDKCLIYSGPTYHQNAIICYLANGDCVAATRAFDLYNEKDYMFNNTYKSDLLSDLIRSCEDFDINLFTDTITKFDDQKKFPPWVLDVLIQIKRNLEKETDEEFL